MSLDVLGVSCVGAGPSRVTITAPYHVLVSPHAVGVVEFGSQFGKGQPSPIDRVVVTGGKVGAPVWDKEDTIFDAPDKVEVYLKGMSQPQVFTAGQGDFAGGIKMAYVAGGTRERPSMWGRSRGNLRMVGADAAFTSTPTGYTDEARVSRVQRVIYNLPKNKQHPDFAPLIQALQTQKNWGKLDSSTKTALNRFNFLYASNEGPIITDLTLAAADSFLSGAPKVTVVESRSGMPYFTDSETVRIVQEKIEMLPQYANDKALSLAPYGADGKWGPVTAGAVRRLNAYYRAGGAVDNDGPFITEGTLAALKLTPVHAPTGVVGEAERRAADAAIAEAQAAKAAADKAAADAKAAPTAIKITVTKVADEKAKEAEERARTALVPGSGIAATWARASTWQKVAVVGLSVFGVSAVSLGVWGIARGRK